MADKVIEIPAVNLKRMKVTIEGVTPLITHRFGERARALIEDKQQHKAKGAKEARNPREEFEDSLYVIQSPNGKPGRYGFPAAGVKKALVSAGGRFAGEKMTELRGVVNVVGDLLEIKGSEPEMRADRVKLQMKSSIAYRPEFKAWEIEVPVTYNASVIGEAQILNLFQLAGFSVGIGDWRPERDGTFGQFVIKGVEA